MVVAVAVVVVVVVGASVCVSLAFLEGWAWCSGEEGMFCSFFLMI
jgi:hypothetical protein